MTVLSALAALACVLAACGGDAPATPAAPAAGPQPPVRHVFVIVLENKDAARTFAADSPAPYLSRTLRRQGLYLPSYYATAHHSLGNYLALVSGQAPNVVTQADCPVFTNVRPGRRVAHGQALGAGCVYPAWVPTIAGQLEAAGRTWGAFMEDMGDDPQREARACAHPRIGERDRTRRATAADQYTTRHNPFVYFHSVIDDAASCAAHDVNLARLPAALADVTTTPSYTFITPDLCHDAHDTPCADGSPGGLRSADAFLRAWVPRIQRSPAFRRDGLLVVTFDEAEGDSSACCAEPRGPNTPFPGGPPRGRGGGRVGAVVLSPFVKPGSSSNQAYNHYALLRTVEDIFGVAHLGYAGQKGLRPFGGDVWTRRPG